MSASFLFIVGPRKIGAKIVRTVFATDTFVPKVPTTEFKFPV